jgi:hypothetical protein
LRNSTSPTKGDDAGDDHGDHHQPDVAIADMGQLMGDHRLDLGVVELLDQAGGQGHRELLVVDAAGEGVERVALEDGELRRHHAARDAEILQHPVELGLRLPRHALGAGDGLDQRDVDP